ncbi:hypothetical protein MIMGU_mgv1a011303mg [Erythranthe guttata]|uniref:GATA-type domain-containing protein n=1 Tax=Erythranthe guttata TaxID=4155 RepID=A0A022R623_ERYGU|nr:hypothetical protein MIMGU_mgv1a011303mg [Erythranthe guttata]
MRKQWPCSKCGFACSSTWRSLNPSNPVICNPCKSKGGKKKVVILPPKQVTNNISSSFDQVSSSSSVMNENQAFTVSQIGMIFGDLPFEPSLTTIPVIVHNQLQDRPKVKSEIIGDDDIHCAIQFQGPVIKIKQEYDCEELEEEKSSIWDTKKVRKKKRSKLPQYTLSPLARFINQLHSIQHYKAMNKTTKNNIHRKKTNEPPKYDDFLIYERCIYVAENEIGLGAVLLAAAATPVTAPPLTKIGEIVNLKTNCEVTKTESCSSASESDANYSNCLVDVPIKGSSCE